MTLDLDAIRARHKHALALALNDASLRDFGHAINDSAADVPALVDEIEQLNIALAEAREERDTYQQHILDIDAHATPYGDIPDEPGWVGTYLVTAGALHRALGKIGHSAPKCEAEAAWQEILQYREASAELHKKAVAGVERYGVHHEQMRKALQEIHGLAYRFTDSTFAHDFADRVCELARAALAAAEAAKR